MTDEQTARKIMADAQYDGELNDDVSHEQLEAAIVRALQAARNEGGKQVVDEAERVSQILQSANTANADSEAKARFEVDRFVFACAGSIVGAEVTDRQKHTLFHQFKGVFEICEHKIEQASERVCPKQVGASMMPADSPMMIEWNGIRWARLPDKGSIIDCTGEVPVVRRVLGTLPITKDGCVLGDWSHPHVHILSGEVVGGTTRTTTFAWTPTTPGRKENKAYEASMCYSTPEAAKAAMEGGTRDGN